jgi:hypothetical protein
MLALKACISCVMHRDILTAECWPDKQAVIEVPRAVPLCRVVLRHFVSVGGVEVEVQVKSEGERGAKVIVRAARVKVCARAFRAFVDTHVSLPLLRHPNSLQAEPYFPISLRSMYCSSVAPTMRAISELPLQATHQSDQPYSDIH